MFFKRNTTAKTVAASRDLIRENSNKMSKLTMLVNDTELKSQIEDIAEKLKYLKPVSKDEDTEEDKSIAEEIEKLKSELTISRGRKSAKTDESISRILLLLVDRPD